MLVSALSNSLIQSLVCTIASLRILYTLTFSIITTLTEIVLLPPFTSEKLKPIGLELAQGYSDTKRFESNQFDPRVRTLTTALCSTC